MTPLRLRSCWTTAQSGTGRDRHEHALDAREEPGLERRLVEVGRQGPGQAARGEAAAVLGDGALREPEALGDLALAAVLLVGETENVEDVAHRDPLGRHGLAPGEGPEELPRRVRPRAPVVSRLRPDRLQRNG